MQRQVRSRSRYNSPALGQDPGCTSRDVHNNIFELFWEVSPQQMEDVNCLMKHSCFQREGPSSVKNNRNPSHPGWFWDWSKAGPTVSLILTNSPDYKTPHNTLQVVTVLRASTCWALFASQSNKTILFCFTQNSVSEIQFSSSVQRPNFSATLWILARSLLSGDGPSWVDFYSSKWILG